LAIVLQIGEGVEAQEVSAAFANFAVARESGLDRLLRSVSGVVDDPRLCGEICLRVCNGSESKALNNTYRGKNQATNILSFPGGESASEQMPLGDLALCWPVAQKECREQGKALSDHAAHLSVHGILHLLGHDHEDDAEAEVMENLEKVILADLGVANPYI
jgi:probable rRNA maturation factor